MSESTLTIVGNLSKDPITRTVRGAYGDRTVAQFSVASSKRILVDGKWDDGPTTFVDVSCWGKMADNVMTTLQKGMGVIVYGRLDQNRWETEDGQKRSQLRIHATAVGPDLRKGKAKVTRNQREPFDPFNSDQTAPPSSLDDADAPLDGKSDATEVAAIDVTDAAVVEVHDTTELAEAQPA